MKDMAPTKQQVHNFGSDAILLIYFNYAINLLAVSSFVEEKKKSDDFWHTVIHSNFVKYNIGLNMTILSFQRNASTKWNGFNTFIDIFKLLFLSLHALYSRSASSIENSFSDTPFWISISSSSDEDPKLPGLLGMFTAIPF